MLNVLSVNYFDNALLFYVRHSGELTYPPWSLCLQSLTRKRDVAESRSQMAAACRPGFDRTRNSAIRSADPENLIP